MRHAVGVDKNYKLLYEDDVVITKYGRICKIVWKDTQCFKGYDLIPMAKLNEKAPDEWDMWNPENLEKTKLEAADLIADLFHFPKEGVD